VHSSAVEAEYDIAGNDDDEDDDDLDLDLNLDRDGEEKMAVLGSERQEEAGDDRVIVVAAMD
jgi:hypothetical protein